MQAKERAMKPHRAVTLLILTLCAASGCQPAATPPAAAQRQLPSWMTDEEESGGGDASPFGVSPAKAQLALQLKPGDRFPLRKVVQQQLTQSSANGQPELSHSQLEVLFAITVEEVNNGRTKLAVRYDRVKYQHDVAGDRVSFDSNLPAENPPVSVWAYRDMVGDGFKFWIGADSQIAEVEGFTDFLKRCLRNVPEELKNSVMLGMEGGSGEDGIANFVDNSIGLLPIGAPRSPGDSWERSRFISRPIPMQLQNSYTLQDLTEQEATIAIRGTIAAGSVGATSADSAQVQVLGGATQGTCTIDRLTGLPKSSRVERQVDMLVKLPQAEFRQQKRVLTTIEAFPVSPGGQVIQVGFEQR